ncbi:unnamed protein product [Caenorhabditis auriculariae]|uniref:Uncharacterized protein n=1 Tax=Caenorhabditis auriculariae TaxID=2777116 RepID=A0A8S1H8A4_9PELO|nr:unnamed protein product [Caenorhabditis auriculariae]
MATLTMDSICDEFEIIDSEEDKGNGEAWSIQQSIRIDPPLFDHSEAFISSVKENELHSASRNNTLTRENASEQNSLVADAPKDTPILQASVIPDVSFVNPLEMNSLSSTSDDVESLQNHTEAVLQASLVCIGKLREQIMSTSTLASDASEKEKLRFESLKSEMNALALEKKAVDEKLAELQEKHERMATMDEILKNDLHETRAHRDEIMAKYVREKELREHFQGQLTGSIGNGNKNVTESVLLRQLSDHTNHIVALESELKNLRKQLEVERQDSLKFKEEANNHSEIAKILAEDQTESRRMLADQDYKIKMLEEQCQKSASHSDFGDGI